MKFLLKQLKDVKKGGSKTFFFKIFLSLKYIIKLPFFIYGLFLAIFSIADFPTSLVGGYLPYLSDKPLGEDGFYMLRVAWNIANGDGITYSTGQLTSGIQPIITFFYSLIAFININFLKGFYNDQNLNILQLTSPKTKTSFPLLHPLFDRRLYQEYNEDLH